MTTHYDQMTTQEAINIRVPSAEDWHSDWEDWRQVVVEITDQTPVRILGCDGGEPEDNTLSRDWCWITDELNKAYHKGYEDGRRTSN